MIPILYDSNETLFTSNGLGRLRDCISCTVTEERNGIYEVDFEYPITGANFDKIQLGRIIGVTHDESDDIQPFDIVSYSRPIDGVVTFHCTHISYRQSKMVSYASGITSLADAFQAFDDTCYPSGNPFTYFTDKESTGYVAAFDGTPRSIRSLLGGVEGSILDAYGGEYEWDRFRVMLHSARGYQRNFSIRYGVNMLDYNEEMDSSGTYMSCVPYWTDGTTTIVGDRQDSGGSTVTGRGECVPLDVSDKFESQPTKAQVNAMGLAVMNATNPMIPSQNIHVEFVRLQDMGYENLENLLECKLCDTINVIFPFYNTSGQFKIVKTVWDVVADRYESMELGDLSVTLAEALGISSESSRTSDMTDFVVEQATSGIWTYRKWDSGIAECWGIQSLGTKAITSAYGNGFYASADTINLPSGLFTSVTNVQATSRDTAGYGTWFNVSNISTTAVTGYMYGISSVSTGVTLSLYVVGKWR